MSDKDGGPAFPRVEPETANEGMRSYFGMTLRDYFAAKAMPMLAAEFYSTEQRLEGGTVADLVAPIAYKFADAMLKAREKS